MCKSCVECGSIYVVNQKHCLCDDCNFLRLHGETRYEASLRKAKFNRDKVTKKKRKSDKKKENTIKAEERHLKDKETYRIVFNSNPNICEECGAPLNDVFEDEEGNVIAVWQYSHIMTKQAWPEFRNNPKNFNRLCLKHHDQWEFGDRSSMNIYENNQKIIDKLFKERNK